MKLFIAILALAVIVTAGKVKRQDDDSSSTATGSPMTDGDDSGGMMLPGLMGPPGVMIPPGLGGPSGGMKPMTERRRRALKIANYQGSDPSGTDLDDEGESSYGTL